MAARRRPAADLQRARMLAVLRQFRLIVGVLRTHYASVEKRTGIGGAQLWALAEIAGAEEITVGDLARRLGIQASTASNLVRALIERGLVRKGRAQGDQRVVYLAMTPEGQKMVRKAPRPLEGLLQSALLRMPRARLDKLHGHLGDLLGRLDGERIKESMLPELVRDARKED